MLVFISLNGPYLPLWAQRIPYLLWAYICEKYSLTQIPKQILLSNNNKFTAKTKKIQRETERGLREERLTERPTMRSITHDDWMELERAA